MELKLPLSDFEIEILNQIIHTQHFSEYPALETGLHSIVAHEKGYAIASGYTNEQDFAQFQSKTVKNINRFLTQNDFYGEREGRVLFLSERGRQLQGQGTLQKYIEWETRREAQILADLHEIETKGYIEKHQTYKAEPKPVKTDRSTHILIYMLILAAIFLIWWFGRSHIL